MAETTTLTDHEEIRDWAAARSGVPAVRHANPSIGSNEPVLMLLFGQHAYQDQDQGQDRPNTMGDLDRVEWDEWFAIVDERNLALVVEKDRPGVREQFHELVAR